MKTTSVTIKRRILSPLPPSHWHDEEPIVEVVAGNLFRAMQKRYGKYEGHMSRDGRHVGWLFAGRIKTDDGLSCRTLTRVWIEWTYVR
jgi:hypothetical protein